MTLQAVLEPGRVILGGGVMATAGLMHNVRAQASAMGAGYFVSRCAEMLVAPGLGVRSGLLGALALAQDALQLEPRTTS